MYKKITALHETGSDARGENYGQRQLGKRLYRARQVAVEVSYTLVKTDSQNQMPA